MFPQQKQTELISPHFADRLDCIIFLFLIKVIKFI